MSDARAERDRRLVQRTAALLSEDYPLEQLIERVCDALCAELNAVMAFVALGDDHRQLRVEGFVSRDDGRLADVSGRSPALQAYRTLEAVLRPGGFELAVPIAYRDHALGVLVLTASSATFDARDEHVVSAIARYLAIAIRNQRLPSIAERGSRSPQVAIATILAIAALLTAAIVAFTSVRTAASRRAETDAAVARVNDICEEMNRYALDARQLVTSTARSLTNVRGDRARVESTLVAMLRSARSRSVYGVGAFYEPYTFDSKTRWYGPYAHWDASHRPVITYEWMRPAYDFQRQPWYRIGIAAKAHVAFTDPYFDTDYVYVTAARQFRVAGRPGGVATVDSIVPTLRRSIRMQLPQGRFAAITSRDGKVLLTSDGTRPSEPQLEAHVREAVGANPAVFAATVPHTGWRVRLWERRDVFDAEARRLQGVAFVAALGIWIAALLTIVVSIRSRRQVRWARALEEQQVTLEREIAERIRAEERLRVHAYRDELTGLPNRAFFMGELAAHLGAFHEDPKNSFGVLFIDIDRFNIINDSLGHATGDKLLQAFGTRLGASARPGEVLSRIGGDEFVLLTRGPGDAARRGAEILQSLRHPFTVSGLEFYVTASIGVAPADLRYETPDEMLRDADVAMYEAKAAGRATVRSFDRSMRADALERLALETDLRRAIEREEIYAEYQPLVSLADGRIAGFEALARWRHPTRGNVPPDMFIKVAEQTGSIVDIDERIIALAAAAAREWIEEYPELFVAVNFSAAHLARVDDLAIVRRALETANLPASALKIEVTESAVMENSEKALELLLGLRELGVTVVVDDFGTGYSSLSHLQRLPVEELKIDRSFIATMLQNEKSAEIVRAILAIAKTLRLSVTAEGVETREQAERLTRLGVEYAQGLTFGMSVAPDMVLRLLRTRLKRSIGI